MKPLRTSLVLLAALALPTLGLGPRATGQEVDTAELYQKVVKAAVYIVQPLKGGYSRGSGSLIDKDKRLVLTNFHVVDEVDTVFVQFPMYNKDGSINTKPRDYMENIPAGKAIKGKVLYRDKTRDLALVQLERVPAGATAIPLAKKSPTVGTPVWNIGSPGAVEQLFGITGGIVRAVGIEDHIIGGGGDVIRLKCKVVTATNPTNPGDSGGPLINKKGHQVAVTESGMTGVQQVNMFVDCTEVWAFLNEKKIQIKDLTGNDDPIPGTKGAEVKKKDPPKKDDVAGKTPPPKDDGNGSTTAPKDKGSSTPPPTAAAPDEKTEQAAAVELKRANLFADADDVDYYKGRLREVVKKFPGTKAAKDAQKKLDALK